MKQPKNEKIPEPKYKVGQRIMFNRERIEPEIFKGEGVLTGTISEVNINISIAGTLVRYYFEEHDDHATEEAIIKEIKDIKHLITVITQKTYWIGNPSAWENYSEEGSEHLRAIMTAAEECGHYIPK